MKFSNPDKIAVIALILMIVIAGAIVAFYPHDIEISYEGNGKVSPTGEQNVNVLSPIEIEIEPSEGWKVGHVFIDNKEINYDNSGKITFRPDIFGFSSHTIHIEFVESTDRLLTINLLDEDSNKINNRGFTNLETGYYEDDSKQILTVELYDNYVIDNILLDGISVGSSNILEITMDSDHTVDVIFREASDDDIHISVSIDIQVDTNVTSAPFGTVSPSGDVKVKYGGSLIIYISLNDGYVLSDVIIDGSSKGPVTSYNITDITGSISISIIILDQTPDKDTYTITATAGNGGYITPSGTLTFSKGHTQTFNITPRSGYAISYLTVDGNRTSASSSYTFTNINDDHTIHAVFVRVVYPDYPVNPNPPNPPVTPEEPTLVSIEITSLPIVTYIKGSSLDLAGLIVTGTYSDNSTKDVTSECTSDPAEGTALSTVGEMPVTIKHTESELTATFEINVLNESWEGNFEVFVKQHNDIVYSTKPSLNGYQSLGKSIVKPGDFETLVLEIKPRNATDTVALTISSINCDSDDLKEQVKISVNYGNTTAESTVSEIISNENGEQVITIGKLQSNTTVTVTITFQHHENNNLAMGKNLSFKLTVGTYGEVSQ